MAHLRKKIETSESSRFFLGFGTALLLGAVIGLAGRWWVAGADGGRLAAPPQVGAGVGDSALPDSLAPEGATASPSGNVALRRPRDWADTISVPEWVLSADGPASLPAAAGTYRGVGGEGAGRTGATAQGAARSSVAPAASDAALAPDAGALSPILVRRVSGQSVEALSLGYGDARVSGGRWAIPGSCTTEIALQSQPGGRGRGEVAGERGEWIFALAVPTASCPRTSLVSVPRKVPTMSQRSGLAESTKGGAVMQALGAPSFNAADLADFVVFDKGGPLFAWGVFRQPLRSTQVYPAPPRAQLAFVARSDDGNNWTFLWGKYVDTSAETLGLAGVHDPDRDRALDAFFVVRSEPGNSRVLRVSPQMSGAWTVAETKPVSFSP